MNEPETDKPDIVLAYAKQFKIDLPGISFSRAAIVGVMIAVLLTGCAATTDFVDDSGGNFDFWRSRAEPAATAEETAMVADARAAAEAGEYRYAVDLLMQALDTTSDPTVARQATQLASAIDDWPAATIAAARWMVLEPESQQAAQFATIAALRQQRVDRAVELLQTRLVGEGNPMDWDSATAILATAGSARFARRPRAPDRAGRGFRARLRRLPA